MTSTPDGYSSSAAGLANAVRPSRRTVVRGAAWSVPVIAVGAAAPAFACSPAGTTGNFNRSTAGTYSLSIPANVESFTFTLVGAPGLSGNVSNGGSGAKVQGTVFFGCKAQATPLAVVVGQGGGLNLGGTGFGSGGATATGTSGGGGGGSAIRITGGALLVVAGGGGGVGAVTTTGASSPGTGGTAVPPGDGGSSSTGSGSNAIVSAGGKGASGSTPGQAGTGGSGMSTTYAGNPGTFSATNGGSGGSGGRADGTGYGAGAGGGGYAGGGGGQLRTSGNTRVGGQGAQAPITPVALASQTLPFPAPATPPQTRIRTIELLAQSSSTGDR